MTLLWGSVVLALIDWYAVARDKKQIEYFAKPLVMVGLIAWFLSVGAGSSPAGWFFSLGMICCLVGDVFLMLPRDAFRQGLVAFLVGHGFYVIALNTGGPLLNQGTAVSAIVVALLAFLLVRFIFNGLQSDRERKLRIPIAIYSLALSLTAWSGMSAVFNPAWDPGAGWLVGLGGMLFFLSDAFLAINRFVRPLPGGRLIHMTAYHLAQFGLALGMWVQLR